MERSVSGEEKTYIYFHLLVETVVHNETVGHAYPVRLHGMPSNIGIIAHIGIIEVGHCLFVAGGPGRVDGGKVCHCCRFTGYGLFESDLINMIMGAK